MFGRRATWPYSVDRASNAPTERRRVATPSQPRCWLTAAFLFAATPCVTSRRACRSCLVMSRRFDLSCSPHRMRTRVPLSSTTLDLLLKNVELLARNRPNLNRCRTMLGLVRPNLDWNRPGLARPYSAEPALNNGLVREWTTSDLLNVSGKIWSSSASSSSSPGATSSPSTGPTHVGNDAPGHAIVALGGGVVVVAWSGAAMVWRCGGGGGSWRWRWWWDGGQVGEQRPTPVAWTWACLRAPQSRWSSSARSGFQEYIGRCRARLLVGRIRARRGPDQCDNRTEAADCGRNQYDIST